MKIKNKNLICPDDKDIYNTLQSYDITNRSVENLFLNHYTLVNTKGSWEFQARNFSKNILSFNDYSYIKSIFDKDKKKRDTTRGILLKSNLSKDETREHFKSHIDEILGINNTLDVRIVPTGGKISVSIDYVVFDFSKNIFNGQDYLSTEIILDFENKGQIFIESVNDKNVDKWQRKLIKVIHEESDKSCFEEIEISLFGITDQEKKLKFYIELIEGIKNFTLDTVVDVFLSRKKDSEPNSDETANNDTEKDINEDSLIDVNKYIKKASFKGTELLNSATILNFLTDSYHIYKIIWRSVSDTKPNEVYEFEVKFNNPEECEEFAYSIHGKYVDNSPKITTISYEEAKPITSSIFQKAREIIEIINSNLDTSESTQNDSDMPQPDTDVDDKASVKKWV